MDEPLPTLRTPAPLHAAVASLRAGGREIALVVASGPIHEGHIALGEAARRRGAAIVYAIAAARPHDPAADALHLQTEDVCDALYVPGDLYSEGFATSLALAGPLATELEADGRAAAFATRILTTLKLTLRVRPDLLMLGEKNYQHLLAVRRAFADLDVPVEIVTAPVLRESDGLAYAAANADLDGDERRVAGKLNLVLKDVAARLHAGDKPAHAAAFGFGELLAAGFDKIDYLEVRDAETLAAPKPGRPLRVLAAARLGGHRLTDTIAV